MPPRIPIIANNASILPSRPPRTCINSLRPFSQTTLTAYPRAPPKEREARGNKLRGMSALRGDGVQPWIRLSVTKDDLKTPRRIKHVWKTNDDHGLWRFFNTHKQILTDPYEESRHGRAWTIEELRYKSFADLHILWWRCQWERNRLLTEAWTRKARRAGFGESEASARKDVVTKTMGNIRATLRERWYAWEDARKLSIGQGLKKKEDLVYNEQEIS